MPAFANTSTLPATLSLMNEIINKYLNNDRGEIQIPADNEERHKLVRALIGFSFTKRLDYWLDFARDYVENSAPKEPFVRDNELSKKDRLLRDTLSKLDDHTKKVLIRLIDSTATGVLFSILTDMDQFGFGKIILSLRPKSDDGTQIEISSETEDLHDELAEWIYSFSKFKAELVDVEEGKYGTSYQLK